MTICIVLYHTVKFAGAQEKNPAENALLFPVAMV